MARHILIGLVAVAVIGTVVYAAFFSPQAGKGAPGKSDSHFHIYVTNEEAGTVTIIDGVTESVVASIPVGKRPRGIKLTPDGKFAYVALSGKPPGGPGVKESDLPPSDPKLDGIGVIDLVQKKLINKLKSGSDPECFDLTKDGATLIISNEDDAEASFLDIKSNEIVGSVEVSGEPEGVTLDAENKLVYITCEEIGEIHAIDVKERKAVGKLKVGQRPRTISIMPDGMTAYVPAETDGAIHKIKLKPALAADKVIPTPGRKPEEKIRPMGTVISPDGKRLYVSTGHGGVVLVLDTSNDSIVKYIEVGKRPWGIALSADGKRLYTANGPSNDVTIVNTETLEVIKKISVDAKPWGIAVGK